MNDIIPSFYDFRTEESDKWNGAFDNYLLRVGEVKRIIYPEDKSSRTAKFVEYDVLVQHRENGTAVTKMYHNCFVMNGLAGLADYEFRCLRAEKISDKKSQSDSGTGSKVLLLCINGAHSEAVIIGGIRDDKQDDKGRNKKGVHMDWEYNGVHVNIKDDGGFSVEYKGPTTTAGKLDTTRGKAESAGTKVEVAGDGGFSISTKDNKQRVVINHVKGTIEVTGDKELTLHAKKINIGSGAPEPAVLGDTLVGLLGEIIDAIATQTHYTPVGTSSPPLNVAKFIAIKLKLKTALSQFIKVKRSP
jgi:hypothetical protein